MRVCAVVSGMSGGGAICLPLSSVSALMNGRVVWCIGIAKQDSIRAKS